MTTPWIIHPDDKKPKALSRPYINKYPSTSMNCVKIEFVHIYNKYSKLRNQFTIVARQLFTIWTNIR